MTVLARIGTTLRRTLLHAIPTALGIVVLVFLLLQLVPGDAADVLASESGGASEEGMALMRARFGLDQPVIVQLIAYLNNLAHFSLGYSPRYNAAVVDLIFARLPGTLLLMFLAQLIALVVGVGIGTVMASCAGKWPDRLLSLAALLLYSTPGFWIGLMALVVFSVWLGWLPSGGDVTIGANPPASAARRRGPGRRHPHAARRSCQPATHAARAASGRARARGHLAVASTGACHRM